MNPFRRNGARAAWSALVVGAVLAAAACGGETSVSTPAPGNAAPPALAAALDRVVQSGIPGVQVVLDGPGGHRVYTAGVGDIGTGAPFQDDALVRIGSNTKTFVATVVLQLVAEGKVDLAAPIERYLPGVVQGNGNDGNRVTVRQLLQHTSGLPDYLGRGNGTSIDRDGPAQLDPDEDAIRTQHFEAAELVRNAMTMPPNFEPGAKSVYTNTNYLLLGMLIERVTGRPYTDEITNRIITPLGLKSTYSPAAGERTLRDPHPRGYHVREGKQIDFTELDPSWGGAAGAMVASNADLNTFTVALLSGKLLPPAQLAQMQQTVPFDRMPGAGYGLGLIHRTTSCGKEVWGHGGSIPGFGTRNSATADGKAVAVAVNQLPNSDESSELIEAVLDTALCAQ